VPIGRFINYPVKRLSCHDDEQPCYRKHFLFGASSNGFILFFLCSTSSYRPTVGNQWIGSEREQALSSPGDADLEIRRFDVTAFVVFSFCCDCVGKIFLFLFIKLIIRPPSAPLQSAVSIQSGVINDFFYFEINRKSAFMRSLKQTETPPDAQNGPVERQQERGKKLWRSPRRVSGHEQNF
jgi:hypothetical protein